MASQRLVERVSEDGRLTKEPMRLTAPVRFMRDAEIDGDKEEEDEEGESVEKVWTIYNPLEFVSMSQVQKRDLLRASGVRSLPRPREGAAALDEVLTDLMDEAVRSEYIRLTTDTENASKVDSRSLKIGYVLPMCVLMGSHAATIVSRYCDE